MKHGEEYGEWPEETWDSSTLLKKLKAFDALDNPNTTKRQKQNANKALALSRTAINDLDRLRLANWLIYDVLKCK